MDIDKKKISLKDEDCPCNECLIRATCKRSFIDRSACDDLWKFVKARLERRKYNVTKNQTK